MIFLLAACAAPTASGPMPTEVTATSTPTVTSILISTLTQPASTDVVVPTATPEVVKEFPICWVEQWRSCPVQVEDLLPVEAGGTGAYLKWLKTQSKPFDPAKIKILPLTLMSGNTVIYDSPTYPNYEDPESRPFRRNVTSGITTINGVDYLLLPVEYPDPTSPGNPAKNVWAIGIRPMSMLGTDLGKPLPPGNERQQFAMWLDNMNIAPWLNDTSFAAGTVPLVDEYWQKVGREEMQARFERFLAGDTTAFDGQLLLVSIGRNTGHWFE